MNASYENIKNGMCNAFGQGEYREALRIADQVLADAPADWDAIFMKSTILTLPDPDVSDPDEAERIMRNAVEAESSDARRWVGLALALDANAKYSEAERAVRHALRLNPRLPDAALTLATLHGSPGVEVTPGELVDVLGRVIEESPDDWRGYVYLGRVYQDIGDISEAARMLRIGVARVPASNSTVREGVEREIQQLQGGGGGRVDSWRSLGSELEQ